MHPSTRTGCFEMAHLPRVPGDFGRYPPVIDDRNRNPLDKDPRIHDLLARLRADLGTEAFVIADHWEGDLCAVGISTTYDPSRLVYVSTYNHADDEFTYELETAPKSDNDIYDVIGRGDAKSYSELLAIIRQHFANPTICK